MNPAGGLRICNRRKESWDKFALSAFLSTRQTRIQPRLPNLATSIPNCWKLPTIPSDFKFPRKCRQAAKKNILRLLSSISLANNRLMDVTQLALTWVGWPNGEKLASNLTSTKVSTSHRKSTQVNASPGQTESQVHLSSQLVSTRRLCLARA